MRTHLTLLALLTACGAKPAPVSQLPSEPAPVASSDAAVGVTDPALQQLLTDHWEAAMQRWPLWATSLGDHRYDDRLPDGSEGARIAWRAVQREFLERAKALDPQGLSEEDRVTAELFAWDLEDGLAQDVCRFEHWSIQPRGNAMTRVNGLPEEMAIVSPRDGQNLLARYRAAPMGIDDEIDGLRMGLADGLAANAHSVQLVVKMLDDQLAQDPADWPLVAPTLVERTWDREIAATWSAELKRVVAEQIRPAFERYRDFLRDEVLPVARPQDQSGLSALPNGAACYAAQVRSFTTLDRSAAEVHQQGLDALVGIHAEFRALGKALWGTEDLDAIFEKLRTDPELYFASEDEVRATAEANLAAARAAIPQWFGRLPQADCVVEAIPDYEAPYTTVAYYRQPIPGERAGTYFINLYEPTTRPRHEAAVLAFHESIPGHHLQIAIAQELPDVPAFRKHGGTTVFVEGWALYTERLADEMGLYARDIDRLGMLSFDAWRASRLVVDTGIHDQGWSREQAVDFFVKNTPLAKNNIDNEVDRYVTWPGQALAYKTGQTEIAALRHQAREALGDDFDIRAFHDVVLGAGAVPLPVLRRRVEGWIATAPR